MLIPLDDAGTVRAPDHLTLTDEQLRLCVLWNNGMPASALCQRFHKTRSAIIGLIKRLRDKGVDLRGAEPQLRLRTRFTPRTPPPRGAIAKRSAPGPRAARRAQVLLEAAMAADARPCPMIPFLDLAIQQCHWPKAGAGRALVCCGRPVDPMAPPLFQRYCAHHRVLAQARPRNGPIAEATVSTEAMDTR